MEVRATFGRQIFPWVSATIGIAVAATIFVGFGPPGMFLQVTVCQMGPEVGSYWIWTPVVLANIPDGGSVDINWTEWNVTLTSGSLSLNSLVPSSNPAAAGEWDGVGSSGIAGESTLVQWTFFHTRNMTAVESGANPCTQPYIATTSVPYGGCGRIGDVIAIPENQTDVTEPHVWNVTSEIGSDICPPPTPGAYVWFDSSFHPSGSGNLAPESWSLCGLSGGFGLLRLRSVAQVPVDVTVPYQGHDIDTTGYLSWAEPPGTSNGSAPTVVYHLSAGWMWSLAPVGPASTPVNPTSNLPSLVAFVRSAC